MKPHYHYLLSLSLVITIVLWFVSPLNLNAFTQLQAIHLITTFLLSVFWLMSFTFEVSIGIDKRSYYQKHNEAVQSRILTFAVLITGVFIYLLN